MTDNHTISCCVPNCNSNSKKDPTKMFIKVPKSVEFEKQWIEIVGKTENYQIDSHFSFCEDHLNLPKDIVNWIHVQNTVLKKDAENGLLVHNINNIKSNLESVETVDSIKGESSKILNSSTISQEKPLPEGNNKEAKETRQFIKRCSIPKCKSNSHDTPEKQFLRFPKGPEARKKLKEIFGKNGMHIFNHERSIFCCSDHLTDTKDLEKYVTYDSKTGLPIRIKTNGLSHIFPKKSQRPIRPRVMWIRESKLGETSRNIDLTKTDQIGEKPRVMWVRESKLGETSRNIDLTKTDQSEEKTQKSEDSVESPKIQDIEEVLIKTEFQLSDEIDSLSREDSNVNTELKNDQETDPIEDNGVKIENENYEVKAEEKYENLQEDTVIVLDDETPPDQNPNKKMYSILRDNVSQSNPQKANNEKYSHQSIQCDIQCTKFYDGKCSLIEKKYPFQNINFSLYEERSLTFLKTINENKFNLSDQRKPRRNKFFTTENDFEYINKLIKSDPLKYVGLPIDGFQNFVTKIQTNTKLSFQQISLVLLKIRENQSFERLGDLFEMSQEEALNSFIKCVPAIGNYLKENIFWPKMNTDSQVPFVKNFFKNCRLIIDCLEIEVEKPKKAHAAEILKKVDKNCYTVKYLISYTIDGLISYMSQGFGGSRNDEFLLRNSGIFLRLPFSSSDVILTDTYFKKTEPLFRERNCELLELSQKVKEQSLGKFSDLKKLQDHVVCIKRRLREFRLISTHANLNHDLSSVLDFAVIIACAIVNLQGSVLLCKE